MKPATLFAIGLLSLAACRPAPEQPSPPTDATVALTDFSVETRQDVGDPWSLQKGADGGVLVLVRYRLANEGEVPAPVTAIPAVRLISPSGMEFLADPGLTEVFLSEVNSGINAKRDGEINPGVSTSDGLIFDVSREGWEKPGWTIGVDGVPDRIPITMPSSSAPLPAD